MKTLLTNVKASTMNGNGRPSTAATYGVFGLLALVIIGVFSLVALGRDIQQVLTVTGPIVVVLIGLLPIISGQTKNTEKLENIERQTNGKLDARFEAVNDGIARLSKRLDDMIGEPRTVPITKPLTDEEVNSAMYNEINKGESKDMSDES